MVGVGADVIGKIAKDRSMTQVEARWEVQTQAAKWKRTRRWMVGVRWWSRGDRRTKRQVQIQTEAEMVGR